jgi:hypothetical protein
VKRPQWITDPVIERGSFELRIVEQEIAKTIAVYRKFQEDRQLMAIVPRPVPECDSGNGSRPG